MTRPPTLSTPAPSRADDAAMKVGQHLFNCGACDSLTGFRCSAGRELIDTAIHAVTADHQMRRAGL